MSISPTLSGPGLFRFFLAILVFITHTTKLNPGTAAVDVFFILSGYWIYVMWTARYSQALYPYLTYLLSRAWRLLPVFILCNAFIWTQTIFFGHLPPQINWLHEIVSSFMFIGYSSMTFVPIGVAWSLDVEVQFYLIAPFIISVISRCNGWIVLAGSAILAMIAMIPALLHANVIPAYLFLFSVGMVAAWRKWNPSGRWAIGSLSASAIFFVVSLRLGHPFFDSPPGEWHFVASYLLALLIVPAAIYTTSHRNGGRYDSMFGDLSYITYLVHGTVLQFFYVGKGVSLHKLTAIGEAFAIIMILSWMIWRFFDRPIDAMRSRWVAGQLRRSAVESEAQVLV